MGRDIRHNRRVDPRNPLFSFSRDRWSRDADRALGFRAIPCPPWDCALCHRTIAGVALYSNRFMSLQKPLVLDPVVGGPRRILPGDDIDVPLATQVEFQRVKINLL